MPPTVSIANRFGKRTTASEVVADMDLSGKTFFLTDGISGVGFQTARALALRNAHVVLGCKSIVKGLEARGEILEEKLDAHVDFLQLDNADLNSVKDCAETYVHKGWSLHCLILNASVYNPVHRITDDEFETTFQVNHLAHFLLTHLLTPLLTANAPSRIVVVAAEAHRAALGFSAHKVTWEHLSPTHTHKLNAPLNAYVSSKLCNILFAHALHKRLSPFGIVVNSVHPGLVRVENGNNSHFLSSISSMIKPWLKTVEQGASTAVFCAVSPEAILDRGGKYYVNCKPKRPSHAAQSNESAERMWVLSELMLHTYDEKRMRTCAKLSLKRDSLTAIHGILVTESDSHVESHLSTIAE